MRLPILALLAGMTVAACSKPKPDIQHMTVSGTPAITASTAPDVFHVEATAIIKVLDADRNLDSVSDEAGQIMLECVRQPPEVAESLKCIPRLRAIAKKLDKAQKESDAARAELKKLP